ncbi:hypothetical protein E2562_036400 [Oryza meyeriana var. granulata]|nr:hypothetical protein E2562_036400 [Oryza meyeriana var. granulata]KAF0920695.1 hypothetical protein E2562_036400 [Oryza meyeriana var. granulata]KAF0920697.1 hypothetical protein E2562_036400 [Oryza meyeriana var. granulata]
MNRCRAFAEAVVIMVCPVLLAIALKKVDLRSQEHGPAVPTAMLVMAAITLISGTVPFLALCFSKSFFNGAWRLPATATYCLAPFSCACLIGLACWIIRLILSERWAYAFPAMGAVFFLCIVIRSVSYCLARGDPVNLVPADALPVSARDALQKAMEGKLDDSLEFLAAVTALLFLGLEGLALEGQINGGQRRLAAPMGICFFACLFGVCFMLVDTIPPPPPSTKDTGCRANIVRNLTVICEIFMAFAIAAVMMSIMVVLVQLMALLLFSPLFLILLVHAFDVAVHGGGGGGGQDAKPASMELSKVTFTGFLAVSIPAIKNGSPSMSTEWFLIFAASAIVSGFAWRLLTHAKMGATANFASFCTHFCIAISTVPFTVMAVKALQKNDPQCNHCNASVSG